jgi:hypothetical protein
MPTTKKRAAKIHDIHDLLKLHIESWGRLSDLIEVCARQRDAGNLTVARKTFQKAEQLRAEIAALEDMARPKQS